MVALQANRSAILESRSARASRDTMIARAAAEAAISDFSNAMGSKDARVFQKNVEDKLAAQTGGCDASGVVKIQPADGTGTQKTNGTSSPGIINFSNCNFAGGEWWQALDLATIESLSAEIGSITGSTNLGYETALGRSAAKPRVIIEPLDLIAAGQAAFASGGGWAGSGRESQVKVFRVTALGYGPTKETVTLLQETWRTQD